MYNLYNLKLFGKEVKEIRESLNFTQKEITEKSNISSKTIRRIENGKVLPKLDTLEILSPILKNDLISLLIQYRLDDYSVFYDIKNKIESKIDSGDFNNLHNEFEGLSLLLSSTKNPYYQDLINQLILFIKAIILYKNNDNAALNKLIESIKITSPAFSLNNYESFIYSSMEIRLLMNIAFVLNKLNIKEKYLEIMMFCMKEVDASEKIYPKLCHNLAGVYRRNKEFQKSIDFSNKGIEACQDNGNFNGLAILYYGKGIAEYRLNKMEYIESLKTSLYLCKAFGQKKLETTIIKNCKNIFDINLEIDNINM